jgi:epoxyqueuosine reductase
MTQAPAQLTSAIRAEAIRLGFELVGVAPAVEPGGLHRFLDWLERGYAGNMQYLPRREGAYHHPRHVLDGARSVVMVAMNYNVGDSRDETASEGGTPLVGRIARYARGGADYHDLLRDRLLALRRFVEARAPQSRNRGIVDTAPLLERDFARLAGLGWFGKNTMLIDKRLGSWFFLAALLTDLELEYDRPHEASHCGTCTRCLDVCPTEAFVKPYVLDARRCISYLTIELRGPVPVALREGIGDWLFGCDLCQEVCPWNRKAPRTAEPAFQPSDRINALDAIALLALSPEEFDRRFHDTPLARPGRAGLLRNAAIVLGNSGDPRAVEALLRSLNDDEPVLRGAAAWSLGRFRLESVSAALHDRLAVEDDSDVRWELEASIANVKSQDRTACPH